GGQTAVQPVRRHPSQPCQASACEEGAWPAIHRLAHFGRRPEGNRRLQGYWRAAVLAPTRIIRERDAFTPRCYFGGDDNGRAFARVRAVLLHAAGSLRTALTEVTWAFEAVSGQRVQAKYGPSGTLKDEIAGGARA